MQPRIRFDALIRSTCASCSSSTTLYQTTTLSTVTVQDSTLSLTPLSLGYVLPRLACGIVRWLTQLAKKLVLGLTSLDSLDNQGTRVCSQGTSSSNYIASRPSAAPTVATRLLTTLPSPSAASMSTTPPLHPTPLHVYTAPIPQTPPPGIPLAPETPTSATGPRLGDLEIGAGGEGNSPPPTPTPERVSQAPSTASMLLLSSARMRAISPPTPAPSPQPFSSSRFSNHHHGTGGGSSHHQDGDSSWSPRGSLDLSHGENEEDLVQLLRGQFSSLSAPMRLRLLTLLVADSPPSTLSPLLPLITPRLKRDFLRTLPVELAFHVLSFVDDVRTLARASGVSRFWRALLDDEGTWKRMCWKSGFGNADATGGVGALDDLGSPVTAGQRLRSLEFGEREIEEGTPAGRERRGTLDRTSLREFAARAEMFGLRPEDQVDLSQQANGWQPSTSGPTSLAGAVAGDNNNWGSSSTGLGIGSTFSAAPIVPSALALRRARTPRSTTPNGDPLPFHQTHSSTDHLPDLATLLDMADISPTDTTAARPARPRSHSSTERVPTASTSSYSSTSALVSPPLHSLSSSLPNHSHRSPAASAPTSGTSTPRKPFSYKTHFKRAYLTESNWLRGPGRLLSTQMSADDGVVTSLGFDSEWIVVGMATSKVHLFEAATGSYVKTLDGHELGVWCLTLVSKGGGPLDDEDDEENRPASKTAPNSSSSTPRRRRAAPPPDTSPLGASYSQPGMRRTAAVNSTTSTSFTNDSPTARSNFFRHGASRGTDDLMQDEIHAASPPRRRRSFHEFGTGSARGGGGGDSTTNGGTGPRTGGMGLGAGGETGDSSQQAGVCGTARGWGQKGAVVVSGGCDRDVRVWDVESGYVTFYDFLRLSLRITTNSPAELALTLTFFSRFAENASTSYEVIPPQYVACE